MGWGCKGVEMGCVVTGVGGFGVLWCLGKGYLGRMCVFWGIR